LKFDPSRLKAPYLRPEVIWQKADLFRKTYWKTNEPPVDIVSIVESDLLLEIRPRKLLRSERDTDALLLGSLKTILVDEDDYMDDRMQNRFRFSVAHEVGHLILHGDIYSQINHQSIDHWLEVMLQIPESEYRWLEYHANDFAGRLLVPVEVLKESLKRAIEFARDKIPNDALYSDAALEYISSHLCRYFGVSDQVILRRLQKEDLWPPKTA
jgi:hypothetical protein